MNPLEPYAQCTSNVERTVCATENTKESSSSITRFTTLRRSGNHINLKIDANALNRRRRASVSAVKYICIKDSEGSMLVSAHAPTLYAV